MPGQNWYVHLQGDTLGPLGIDTIILMLKQGRLQFLDFVWADHLTKWQRVADLDEFQSLIPPYPSVPIPSRGQSAAAPAEREEKLTIKTEPSSPPKTSAPPAPTAKPVATEKPAVEKPIAEKKRSWPKARRFPRIPAHGTAEVKDHGSFKVLNVSEGGVFLKSDDALAIGTELKFTLKVDFFEKALDMTGVVIRHGADEGGRGFAIEFTRLNPAHKRVLHEFVTSKGGSSE